MEKKITKKETKRRLRIDTKKQFKAWGELVKIRDRHQCAICGDTKLVHAHHILPRELKDYRFNINNGISLCCRHHKYSYEISPHKNALIFIIWLLENRTQQIVNLLENFHCPRISKNGNIFDGLVVLINLSVYRPGTRVQNEK